MNVHELTSNMENPVLYKYTFDLSILNARIINSQKNYHIEIGRFETPYIESANNDDSMFSFLARKLFLNDDLCRVILDTFSSIFLIHSIVKKHLGAL